jgi:hypothetical protein
MRTPSGLYQTTPTIYECEFNQCPHCGHELVGMSCLNGLKTVQMLNQVRTIAYRPKRCSNAGCASAKVSWTSASWQGIAMTAKVSSAAFANGSYPLPVKLGLPDAWELIPGPGSLVETTAAIAHVEYDQFFCKSAYVSKSTAPLSDFTPVPPNNPSFNSQSCSSDGRFSLLPRPHSDFCAIA